MTTIDITKHRQFTGDDHQPVKRPTGELRPLVAPWVLDRTQFTDTVTKAARRGGHRALWHLLRSPMYLARLVAMSPRGAWRVARAVHEVLSDGQGHQLRVEASTGGDSKAWLSLRKERNERIHRRLLIAATLAAPLVLAVLAMLSPALIGGILGALLGVTAVRLLDGGPAFVAFIGLPVAGWVLLPMALAPLPWPPTWLLVLVGSVAVVGLGWVGRPLGKPLVKPATVLAGNHGPLRAPFVMQALCSLGIAGLNDKTMDQIGLLFDVARTGPGYQCDMELPRGVAAGAVLERRSQLSAALRRELGCVWPSVGKRHEGHLVLFVADEPMTGAKQARWPLLRDGKVDLFAPVPMFTNQLGRWVDVTFAYGNMVIGAIPRQGKTFVLRQALLVAGLDVRAKVYAIDGKGTGDLAPCALFAHFYGVGDEPEDVAAQLDAMRGVRAELRRRARVIRDLPREECPESKVTSALANRPELGLEPIVVGVDETQVLFQDQPKAIREEFVAIFTDLVKRGPALGIIVLLATQNVTKDTIPTAISTNAVIRFCLKVFGYQANDQVLGTGAYKAGVDATMFAPEDKGIGYLRADGAEAQITRSVHGLDAVAAEKVALRARAMRSAAGRLSGYAAGEAMESEAEQVVLLDDVRQVLAGAEAMHSEDVVAGLAHLRPQLYGGLDVRSLGSQLRAAGVNVEQVYVSDKPRELASRKGVRREWLDVAATEVIGERSNVRHLPVPVVEQGKRVLADQS